MASVNETIDVAVPVSVAYNQWTQFESFPQFMHGVQSVRQLSDTSNHWTMKVAGADKMQVKSDLKRFKEFIETRGSETGAWRGNVDHPGDASTRPYGASETARDAGAAGASTGGTGAKDNSLGSRDYYGGTGAGGFPPGGTNKDDLPIQDPAARSDKPLLDDPALGETSRVPLQDVPGGTLNDPDNEPDPDTDETGRNAAGR